MHTEEQVDEKCMKVRAASRGLFQRHSYPTAEVWQPWAGTPLIHKLSLGLKSTIACEINFGISSTWYQRRTQTRKMPEIFDDKSEHFIPFILERLEVHRKKHNTVQNPPPFFLGLNGVQGAGKTTLVGLAFCSCFLEYSTCTAFSTVF